MIKVLLLNYEYPPLGGGAGSATAYLLKEYTRLPDLNVTLVTSSTGKYRQEQPAENITIHFLDISKHGSFHYQSTRDLLTYTWKAWRFCRHLAQQQAFDLAHAFFGVPCGLISLMLGLPTIVSLRGSDVPFYSRRFRWMDKLFLKRLHGWVWRRADHVIANSQGLRELALQSFPKQAIDVIPNGVDTHLFYPAEDKTFDGTLKIFSAGRLIERKGYDLLIKALSGLENVTLTLAGEGQERTRLQALSQEHSVNVNFLGRVDHSDLPDYYRQADLFVLPSRNEGMPNAALEAMASGLPLILTDTGGVTELLKGNGLVISKNNVTALQQAIARYCLQPDIISEEGSISLKIAQVMAWQKVGQAYKNLYQKMI